MTRLVDLIALQTAAFLPIRVAATVLGQMAELYSSHMTATEIRTMQKTLDEKLARIAADPSCKDFILADAKDADMAFGLAAPGLKRQPTDGRIAVPQHSETTGPISARSSSSGWSTSC